MLDVKIGKDTEYVKFEGSLPELCTDICCIIKGVYGKLSSKDKELFSEAMEHMVKDKVYALSVEEMSALCKKKREESKELAKKRLEDLLKGLFDQ